MKIPSIRLGFANNSSSLHSILVRCKNAANEESYDFGWQEFHLKSSESKLAYLALQLFYSLPDSISRDYRWMIIEKILGIDLSKETIENGNIDHQSILSFPYNFIGTELHRDFVNDFRNLILREDVSIVGGNDNENHFSWDCEDILFDENHNPNKNILTNTLPRDEIIDNKLVAKKDGNFYILFNRNNGTKIRINFQDQDEDYLFSGTPELIDIKITSKCNRFCSFCLVPDTKISTPQGEIAISEIIKGDIVYSFDLFNNTKKENIVEEKYERHYEGDIIEIEIENGKTLSLTPDHPVYVKDKGWTKAKDIQEEDELIVF